jgi:hypothetical protein
MPSDLMSLPLLVGLVAGALWIVVFAVVAVAAKIYPDDMEAINSPHDHDVLEHEHKSRNRAA